MKQKIVLKWQSTSPPHMMDPMYDSAKRINERTDGQVTVECYGSGGLVSPFDVFPAVQSGQLDIGFTTSGYGKSAALLPRSSAGELPIWPSGEAGCAFTKAVLDKYIRNDLEALEVTPLFYEINMADDFGLFCPPYVTDLWFNREFASLEEAKGAKIMTQHWTASEALRLIGMEPVEIPYPEIPTALKNGTIDGALIVCWVASVLKFEDLMKCSVRIGFPQCEDAFTFMNKKVYYSLSEDIQSIITDEIRNWWRVLDRRLMIKESLEIWDKRIKDGKLKMVELTPSEKAFCKQQWEITLVDNWVKHKEAAGLKDAKTYVDDLKKIKADILASGLPLCQEPPLR